jgi:hypothetical protein
MECMRSMPACRRSARRSNTWSTINCVTNSDKQHATRNWSQETSEEVDEERKRKELHHDVRNEASNAWSINHENCTVSGSTTSMQYPKCGQSFIEHGRVRMCIDALVDARRLLELRGGVTMHSELARMVDWAIEARQANTRSVAS